jgi:SEC-C motif-containing protein
MSAALCPCGSQEAYAECCEPIITGKSPAPSAEALMRARYSAHVKVQASFLRESLAPETRHEFNEAEVREWASQSHWKGLKILRAEGNIVEFVAKYEHQGRALEHREVSTFRNEQGRWYFVDGVPQVYEEGKTPEHGAPAAPRIPVVRSEPKLGRNDPCHCGSGKKFKKCHGADE